MVTSARPSYTRDFLTSGICSLIKHAAMVKLMQFPAKIHTVMLWLVPHTLTGEQWGLCCEKKWEKNYLNITAPDCVSWVMVIWDLDVSDVVVVVQEISLLTSCCSDLPTWAVTHTLWWLIDSNFFHFFKRWRELQRTSPCTWQRTAASLWQVCPPTTWNIWPTPCTRSPSKRRSRSTLVQAVARGAFWYIHVTQVLQQRCNSSA